MVVKGNGASRAASSSREGSAGRRPVAAEQAMQQQRCMSISRGEEGCFILVVRKDLQTCDGQRQQRIWQHNVAAPDVGCNGGEWEWGLARCILFS